jgi:hypothetical protein
MDENDYLVVMVYDDHIIVFDTFARLDYNANRTM